MKLKLFTLGLLAYQTAFSGDVSMVNQLSGQNYSRTIEARPQAEDVSKVSVAYERLSDIKLLTTEETYGSGTRFHLGLSHGFSEAFSGGISANLITEDEASRDLDIELPSTHGQLAMDLRYNIFNTDLIAASLITFLESGFGPKHHYLVNSKSRIGNILALSVGTSLLELTGNVYFRYRPVDVHGEYRLSHDWGSSAMLRSQLGVVGIFAEVAEQNLEVLKIHRARDGYYSTISQQHSVGMDFDLNGTKVAIFAKKAMANKTLGAPAQSFGLQFSIPLGAPQIEAPTPKLIDPEPKEQEMSPGEKIYWLDHMREEMALRSPKVGQETDHLGLLEEGSTPLPKKPSRQALIDLADKELEAMTLVEERIEKKKGTLLEEISEPVAPLKETTPPASVSH